MFMLFAVTLVLAAAPTWTHVCTLEGQRHSRVTQVIYEGSKFARTFPSAYFDYDAHEIIFYDRRKTFPLTLWNLESGEFLKFTSQDDCTSHTMSSARIKSSYDTKDYKVQGSLAHLQMSSTKEGEFDHMAIGMRNGSCTIESLYLDIHKTDKRFYFFSKIAPTDPSKKPAYSVDPSICI